MKALKPNWLFLLSGLLFLILNIIRMEYVAVTCDEAYSYIYYVSKSYTHIATNAMPTANNHILNSLLSKLFVSLFKDNLFFLRLANLLAQVVYLWFSYKIAKALLQSKREQLILFLLLQLNIYLFEFWGLSRGYGISIAAMLGSTCFLISFFKDNKSKDLIRALIFSIVAVYANMAILNFFAALSLALILIAIVRKEKLWLAIISVAIASIVVYYLLADVIEKLIAANELYFGGEDGFVVDTVQSLLRQTFYLGADSTLLLIVSYCIVAFIVVVLLYQTYNATRAKQLTIGFVLTLLLVLPALSTIAQHHLFNTKYLIERTGLFLYPLFILSFIMVLKAKSRNIYTLFLMLLAINFVLHYNISSTKDWNLDKSVPHALKKVTERNHNQPIKIYMGWRLTPATYYSIQTKDKEQFDKLEWSTDRFYSPEEYDYYFLSDLENEDIPASYKQDTTFVDGRVILYKRR